MIYHDGPPETVEQATKRKKREPKVWTAYCGDCLATIQGTGDGGLKAAADEHQRVRHGKM